MESKFDEILGFVSYIFLGILMITALALVCYGSSNILDSLVKLVELELQNIEMG